MHELADEHRGEGGMELLEAADIERATDFKSSFKFVAGKRGEKIVGRTQFGGQLRESIAQPRSVFTFEHREKFIAYTVAQRRLRDWAHRGRGHWCARRRVPVRAGDKSRERSARRDPIPSRAGDGSDAPR